MKWQKAGRLILTLLLLGRPAACGGSPMPAEPAVPVPEETAAAPEEKRSQPRGRPAGGAGGGGGGR